MTKEEILEKWNRFTHPKELQDWQLSLSLDELLTVPEIKEELRAWGLPQAYDLEYDQELKDAIADVNRIQIETKDEICRGILEL